METHQQTVSPPPLPLRWKLASAAFLLALWAIGLSLQNPGLMADDSGEMVAAAVCLGLPHPPGYPLFTLLGNLACHLPLGTPAFRVSLLSLGFLIVAVAVTVRTGRRMLCGGKGARQDRWVPETLLLATALYLFFSGHVLGQALTPKGGVYTLTLLFLALIVDRFVSEGMRVGPKTLVCVGVVWCLGMGNHWQTQALWIPALLGVFVLQGRSIPTRVWFVALALGLSVLSIYLVLPILSTAHPMMQWWDASSWDGFRWGVSRQLVSDTEGRIRDWATYRGFVAGYVTTLFRDACPIVFILALVGGWVGLSRRDPGTYLALGLYLPMTAAVLFYAREEVSYLVGVYLVAGQGLLVLGALIGVATILRLPRRVVVRQTLALLFLAGALLWAPRACEREDKSRYLMAQDLGTNILQAIPRDAFFLAEGDLTVFPIWYSQVALGQRRDVAMVPPHFFLHPWGWEQAVRLRPQLSSLRVDRRTPEAQWEAFRGIYGKVPYGEPGGLLLSMDRQFLMERDPAMTRSAVPSGLSLTVTDLPVGVAPFLERSQGVHRHRRYRFSERPEGSRGTDVVSRQIRRYYAEDRFQDAWALESQGAWWESLDALDEGFRWAPDDIAAFAGAVRVLGKMGFNEAAVDLGRRGMAIDPTSRTLRQNLGRALALAEREPSLGKTGRYNALLTRSRAERWESLFEPFLETHLRLQAEKGREPHGED